MRGTATLLFAGLLGLAATAASAASDAATPTGAAAAAVPDPAALRAPVERLYAALGDVVARAEELGFDGRYRALEPVVASSYDVPFMARLILGSSWRALTPEQQARWVESFTRFTVSTYADRFDGSGIRFEIGANEPAAQGTNLVRTTLYPEADEPVRLDYRVRAAADGWRIVDVYLSGTVSELALRRSEYSALMKREGFDKLLAALDEKAAAAREGTSEEEDAP